ncbi:hypothetical protein Nepgr_008766 [Nepenthes gracilis]|uniref:Uncharacterized protein n=1 Tax=Nepenthes gracilis TaxID=150966 RepID=A0AAD3S9K9_NEPGR|nr:hypothetical protein Nepgr_008766 [Nepenthes gracilis]
MAASKLLVISMLLFALISTRGRAEEDVQIQVVEESRSDGSDSSAATLEVDQLKSKIQLLENLIEKSNEKLKLKDENLVQLEKVIQEKSDNVASLQNDIELLQKKGTSDAEEQVGKAHAHVGELQKQVDLLKKEIEAQNMEKDALEARAAESEKKIRELNLTLEDLQKINEDLKVKIYKTERALQMAEEELMKAKFEATSKSKELMEVYGAWLPTWLADHALSCQSFIVTKWNGHGKPVIEIITQKMLEMMSQSKEWTKPHIETAKTRLIPAMKEYWVMIIENVEPHLQSISIRTAEVYAASKDAMKPHIMKIHEVTDPYYQEVKRFSKPYVVQAATLAKPYVEKARVTLRPYTDMTLHAYRNFLESATLYHHQVQAAVHKNLKNHELTKHLATKELVWFVASALLLLPIIILSRICSAIFCQKSRKLARNAHSEHKRRKDWILAFVKGFGASYLSVFCQMVTDIDFLLL